MAKTVSPITIDDEETISKVYCIPKVHMNGIIETILKNDDRKKKFKITQKARRLMHMHTEIFITELFSLSNDIQSIQKSKTLDKQLFQLCSRWMMKDRSIHKNLN